MIIIHSKRKCSLTFYSFHKNHVGKETLKLLLHLANSAWGPSRVLSDKCGIYDVCVYRSVNPEVLIPHILGHDQRTSLSLTLWVNSLFQMYKASGAFYRSFSFSRSSAPYLHQHPHKSKWSSPHQSWDAPVKLPFSPKISNSSELTHPHPSHDCSFPARLRSLQSGREDSQASASQTSVCTKSSGKLGPCHQRFWFIKSNFRSENVHFHQAHKSHCE